MVAIAVDTFMEVNGDLVWLVDDNVIDSADKVKKSYRSDVYPLTLSRVEGERCEVKHLYRTMSKQKGFNPNSYFLGGEIRGAFYRRGHMKIGDIEKDIPLYEREYKKRNTQVSELRNRLDSMGVGDSFRLSPGKGEDIEFLKRRLGSNMYRREDKRIYTMRTTRDKYIRVWRLE
jgi:hypothetical protein